MTILKRKSSKAIALALASVLQVYASGGLALAAPKRAEPAAKPAARQDAQGRLTTAGDNPVTVNGNSAKTGETIFSGQQIQTPAGTGATVQLGTLGSVEIAPGSNVTLTFSGGTINVTVTSGCVKVNAARGVTGTIQSSGSPETTGADGGTIDNCDSAPAGAAAPVGGATAGGGLGTAASVALTAAIVGAFALIAHELISDSENETAPCSPIPANPSLGTPAVTCST